MNWNKNDQNTTDLSIAEIRELLLELIDQLTCAEIGISFGCVTTTYDDGPHTSQMKSQSREDQQDDDINQGTSTQSAEINVARQTATVNLNIEEPTTSVSPYSAVPNVFGDLIRWVQEEVEMLQQLIHGINVMIHQRIILPPSEATPTWEEQTLNAGNDLFQLFPLRLDLSTVDINNNGSNNNHLGAHRIFARQMNPNTVAIDEAHERHYGRDMRSLGDELRRRDLLNESNYDPNDGGSQICDDRFTHAETNDTYEITYLENEDGAEESNSDSSTSSHFMGFEERKDFLRQLLLMKHPGSDNELSCHHVASPRDLDTDFIIYHQRCRLERANVLSSSAPTLSYNLELPSPAPDPPARNYLGTAFEGDAIPGPSRSNKDFPALVKVENRRDSTPDSDDC